MYDMLLEAFDRKNELYDALNRDYVKLRDENIRLRKALEFYADEDVYTKNIGFRKEISVDGGEIARKALEDNS